jgi:hypothetical protein
VAYFAVWHGRGDEVTPEQFQSDTIPKRCALLSPTNSRSIITNLIFDSRWESFHSLKMSASMISKRLAVGQIRSILHGQIKQNIATF